MNRKIIRPTGIQYTMEELYPIDFTYTSPPEIEELKTFIEKSKRRVGNE